MKRFTNLIILMSLASFLGAQSAVAQHLVTETYNLEQMVRKADRIVAGTVIGVTEDYIFAAGGTIPITVYTLTVDDALKGSVGNTLTIKQVGHRSDPSSVFATSVPEYKVGAAVMLFLHADSQYGLTSPVGLGQGAFLVKTRGPVKVSVSNTRGNRGLLEGSARIDALLHAESPMGPHPLKIAKDALPYVDFRNFVMKLLQP